MLSGPSGETNAQPELAPPTTNLQSIERSLLEYCTRLFEAEVARKERIEKKSQFYMSFVAVFLGAIFLKHDFLEHLAHMLKQGSPELWVVTGATYVFLSLLATFIVFSLVAILGTMSVRDYVRGSPANLDTSLFAPYSKYFRPGTEADFFRVSAKTYALAVEHNGENNRRKGGWLRVASYGVVGVLFSLAGLLVCVMILSLSSGG